MKPLTKLIRELFTFPPSEADRLRKALTNVHELHAEQLRESDAIWREQIEELINQHCDERRQWAREKRELIELEQRARTAMDNTQALMNPVPANLVPLTPAPTPTKPKLCLGEVASGQRREVRQAAVFGLQVHKDD